MLIQILIALLLILVLNYAVFLLAFKQQTDHYTDITYAFSFVLVAVYFFITQADYSIAKIFLTAMVVIWGIRLGLYLKIRVKKTGEDKRFVHIRPNFWRFFRFFTIQGFSIWILSLPVIIGLHKNLDVLSWIQYFGMALLLFGFLIETIADAQKYKFRNNSEHDGLFMNRGLYKSIRHPNYLGEILFWLGSLLLVAPQLVGAEWIAIISPIWITILLTKISGIPLLEKSSYKRYGHLDSYQKYFKKSSRLLPGIY